MAEDKQEYNSKEFIDQLRAINDENKISMDELDTIHTGNCPICYEKLQFLKYDNAFRMCYHILKSCMPFYIATDIICPIPKY